MSARGYAELRDVLAHTYTPEGVEVWLRCFHIDGVGLDDLMDAGRDQEVIDIAKGLYGQVAT